ncbi:MAG TPA: hypothetical protein VN939_15135 [Chthoniobacterales bacterium]|nr:hypothetical protein [Chthoniobacterales bacterium]
MMKMRGYLAPSERRYLAVALAGFSVFSTTVVSGFAQKATDALRTTGQPKNQVVATIPVGMSPQAVVVNPASGLIYVANQISNSISVIEATTNTVAVVIPVGINPIALAITPDAATVYAANANQGQLTISVINTPTNTVTETIDAGSGEASGSNQLAVSPDGTKLYVATGFLGGGVPVIDTSTNEVSATIKIDPPGGGNGQAPVGVVFNSSGGSAYVTSTVSEKRSGSIKLFVSKIDTATEKQVNVTSPFGVSGLGWTTIYGHTIYVTDDQDTVVLDTKTKKVVKTLPAEFPTGSAITPDGTYLYIPSEPYVVATIDTTTYKVVDSIVVGRGPSAIAIAPNGLRAYVANSTDGTVSVIDISTQ